MPQYSVFIARFPYLGAESPDVADWLVDTVVTMREDKRISDVYRRRYDSTPITMTRNQALVDAKRMGCDYLLWVDSDMSPDLYVASNPNRERTDPLAKPFWKTAWDFALERRDHHELVCIAAPYCGPPPQELPYIFRWTTNQSNHPNPDMSLLMYTREEAAIRGGIEEVAALPTGLMLLDLRALELIEPKAFTRRQLLEKHRAGEITTEQAMQSIEQGYCWYEWKDRHASKKASTEDVVLTRELSMNGCKMYCTWDCWAGHWKHKRVGKPHLISSDQVSGAFMTAKERGMIGGEQLIFARNGVSTKEYAK